jgi:uncharacterized membrane protein
MRSFVLIYNSFLMLFMVSLMLFTETDTDVIVWLSMFFLALIPSTIFAYQNKPIDYEKEQMRRDIEQLKAKITDTDKQL